MAKKLRKFLILLDNESLLYFPGAFLTGRVLVDLDEDTAVTGLYFHIVGEGVVRLNDRGSGSSHNDRENYIDFRMKLLGENPRAGGSDRTTDSDRVIILSPGVHSFPFKLGLPLGLPSTFLGKHGWVQYYCKTALKEPSGLTHKNQQVFIVMSPIDLNLEPPLLMQPFHCEIEETLGIPCLNSGPVACRVRLDRGGYVPGESICIHATIDNGSRMALKKTKAVLTENGAVDNDTLASRYSPSAAYGTHLRMSVTLENTNALRAAQESRDPRFVQKFPKTEKVLSESVETIQYTAKNKIVQSETRELASLQRGRIPPGTTDNWKNEMLYIPPLPPTNLRGCHLIKIQYDVYFMLEPKGAERTLKLQLPIMMATYPIRNSDGTLQRRKGTSYPSTLPVFRPWLNTSKFK